MAEILTLVAPETKPNITTWRISKIFFDVDTPSINIDLISNTGEIFVWRYVVSEGVTANDIRAGLSFINQGKFMAVQGKSLQKWILDKINSLNVKEGSVSGTVE